MNHFAVHLELTQHCKSTILQYKIKVKKVKNKKNVVIITKKRRNGFKYF